MSILDMLNELDEPVDKSFDQLEEIQFNLGIELRPLLWNMMEQQIPAVEREVMKKIIGVGNIEENEMLHNEMKALLEIFSDLSVANDLKESKLQSLEQLNMSSSKQRELVATEISLLLEAIQSGAKKQGVSDPERYVAKALNPETPRERTVFDYVRSGPVAGGSTSRPSSRPGTASRSLRPSTASSNRSVASGSSRPGSALSSRSGGGEGKQDSDSALQEAKPFLSFFEIDKGVEKLRMLLQQEKDYLLTDIEYLTDQLEQEADFQQQVEFDPVAALGEALPPSVQELKQVNSKLKVVLKQQEQDARFLPAAAAASSAHPLRSTLPDLADVRAAGTPRKLAALGGTERAGAGSGSGSGRGSSSRTSNLDLAAAAAAGSGGSGSGASIADGPENFTPTPPRFPRKAATAADKAMTAPAEDTPSSSFSKGSSSRLRDRINKARNFSQSRDLRAPAAAAKSPRRSRLEQKLP
mmetsp:Transcript_42864/g.84023  ORF Transcript_42864/g.84023 Transcript_42864/m.84023 type:complete len:469 (-) Transcript_42864:50-1456(-)|eukprot:CAMPEP_0175128722 /NCGR_PEP_ID=MMETSP0087-20121206/5084_1 /TAXON_ID=136419 /ORGANISM="Unknown Unknown, Strain D1" /LENGTH=468 /DNA_ID=CAMNT_0016410811 /DNA_START=82 /DNA_END=1488 /DNA_ORIENTATION=-